VLVVLQMYEAACCDDMLAWSMSARPPCSYEPCVAPVCGGGSGLQCGAGSMDVAPAVSTRPQYGTCSRTMTNRALMSHAAPAVCRPAAHTQPADCLGMCQPRSLHRLQLLLSVVKMCTEIVTRL